MLAATALHPLAVARPRRGSRPVTPTHRAQGLIGDPEADESPDELAHLIVIPVQSLDLPTVRTLAYAASLSQPVLAVHLAPNEQDARRFRREWQAWGDHLPLEVGAASHVPPEQRQAPPPPPPLASELAGLAATPFAPLLPLHAEPPAPATLPF